MKKTKAEKAVVASGDFFPDSKTPLGEAAEEFVGINRKMAKLKEQRVPIEDKILIELEKEGRFSLVIVVEGHRWFFEVNRGKKKLVCKDKGEVKIAKK